MDELRLRWIGTPGARARPTLLLILALAAGCSDGSTFAQHPGFDEWFDAHPPDPYAASREERELLRRYRPELRVPGSAAGPLDFYSDYIAHGSLEANGGRWTDADRERLIAAADDPDALFRHAPPADPAPQPTAYGRVRYRTVEPLGELTFLQWHFAFRYSGLPFDLRVWQEVWAGMVATPRDWHQLDHFTAATLVLGPDGTPLGTVLQQHNYPRAYWFGRDLAAPDDGRLRLAAAVRSNELYPWRASGGRHRVVRFMEPDNVEWLATGSGSAPWAASYDVTVAGEPVDYRLEFLPGTDPFYRFQGRLGERRMLPGRDGPPGADYNPLPALKDPALQFCALRWPQAGDDAHLTALRRLIADPGDGAARERLMADCRAFIAEAIGYNAGGRNPGPDR